MRPTSRLVAILFSSLLWVPAVFAQTNPPAPDPHELVTRDSQTLTDPGERSAALAILDRAQRNFDLRDIATPYRMTVSFETSGTTQLEGKGSTEELTDGPLRRRFTAQFQDWQTIRINNDGRGYATNASEPIPLRVQLVRSALHEPITPTADSFSLRTANVNHDGKEMECVMLAGSIGRYAAPRAWTESEYCIETSTGRLQVWSEAPGIFAVYDYNGATEFHGHTLPKQISIFEDGRLIVQESVDSLEDVHDADPNLFEPTADMVDAGQTFSTGLPVRFPIRIEPIDAPASNFFQFVIVHATLDAQDGTVIDAEPLQNYDPQLTRVAMDLLRNSAFPPTGFQREVFINVQFHVPAERLNGPPMVRVSVRVHFRILDHEVTSAPPRRPRPVTK